MYFPNFNIGKILILALKTYVLKTSINPNAIKILIFIYLNLHQEVFFRLDYQNLFHNNLQFLALMKD